MCTSCSFTSTRAVRSVSTGLVRFAYTASSPGLGKYQQPNILEGFWLKRIASTTVEYCLEGSSQNHVRVMSTLKICLKSVQNFWVAHSQMHEGKELTAIKMYPRRVLVRADSSNRVIPLLNDAMSSYNSHSHDANC